ncbi:MAG: flagellar basal body P-ring formation chaperone FlgA, partial [Shewanella sp.]
MKVNIVCFFSLFVLFMPAFASAQSIVPTVSAISELAKALILEKISVPANAKVDISPQMVEARM